MAGNAIRHDPVLRSWMLAYAEWLATNPWNPTNTERCLKLGELSRMQIHKGFPRELEQRDDFQHYVEELSKGPVEEARAKYMSRLPMYIDAHAEALERARAAGDHRAMAEISLSAIDRVLPKRELAQPVTQVNVTLSPGRLAGFNAYDPTPIEVIVDSPDSEPAQLSAGQPSLDKTS